MPSAFSLCKIVFGSVLGLPVVVGVLHVLVVLEHIEQLFHVLDVLFARELDGFCANCCITSLLSGVSPKMYITPVFLMKIITGTLTFCKGQFRLSRKMRTTSPLFLCTIFPIKM